MDLKTVDLTKLRVLTIEYMALRKVKRKCLIQKKKIPQDIRDKSESIAFLAATLFWDHPGIEYGGKFQGKNYIKDAGFTFIALVLDITHDEVEEK